MGHFRMGLSTEKPTARKRAGAQWAYDPRGQVLRQPPQDCRRAFRLTTVGDALSQNGPGSGIGRYGCPVFMHSI